MRNDLTACDRPTTATAVSIGRRASRRRRIARGLLALPLALALIAPGASALAAESTSGYGQTTPAPKTETAPKQETAPTQTSSTAKETPSSETAPTNTSTEPTATTATGKTLPFTGLDLRWITIGGLLLVGMGMSIVVVQRRRSGAGR